MSATAVAGAGALIGATALNVAGQLGANGMNAGFASGQTYKQRKYNEAMYNRQLADTLHYSSPSYQVQKLKEAGLNPYLAVNGGQTIQSPTALPTETAKAQFGNPMEAVGQIPLLKAQIDNINADTKLKEKEAGLKDTEININKLALDNMPQKIRAELDIMWQRLANLGAEGNLTNAKIIETLNNAEKLVSDSDLSKAQREYIQEQTKYVGAYYELEERKTVVAEMNNILQQYGLRLTERGVEVQEKLADADLKIKEATAELEKYRADHPVANETVPKYIGSAISLLLSVLALRSGGFFKSMKPIGYR